MNSRIPFNWPHMTGKELYNIAEAHFNGMLAGNGPFTRRCHDWLEQRTGCSKALLTQSSAQHSAFSHAFKYALRSWYVSGCI